MAGRSLRAALAILLVMVPRAWTYPVRFHIDSVDFDSEAGRVAYRSFQPVAVGAELTLSSRAVYLRLRPGESIADVTYRSTEVVRIGAFRPGMTWADIPTAAEPDAAGRRPDLASEDRLGRDAVVIDGETDLMGERHARLWLFPVTVDTAGGCFFNGCLVIEVGNRPISAEDLLAFEDAAGQMRGGELHQGLATGSGGVLDYVIVTGDDLLAPMQQLARYRRATGVESEVFLIDDIVSTYEGRDDAERLREFLKEFRDQGGAFVLLAGDETVLPVRYAYPYSVATPPAPEDLQICDLYFADLTGQWDADDDGVWGERVGDNPDIVPELCVGRLPLGSSEEASHYVTKLIRYESDPGTGDCSYLGRAFFFCSDQMRDYSEGGQHALIASVYPEWFVVDTAHGIELASGDDPTPYNPSAVEVAELPASQAGIVNMMAHGCGDRFAVRTSGYNWWPKSYFVVEPFSAGHAEVTSLGAIDKPSFYYSIACDNGAFDKDGPPFADPKPNLAQAVLGHEGGAVALIANTRWGWVSSSHYLQKAFYDSLFAHPGRAAAQAMYSSKLAYPYSRDLVYGQGFFGDPALKVYTRVPGSLSLTVQMIGSEVQIEVLEDGFGVDGCLVVMSDSSRILARGETNADGQVVLCSDISQGNEYTVAAVKTGYITCLSPWTASVTTGVEPDRQTLPHTLHLEQNYPNPFNPETTIPFSLDRRARVRLTIHNSLGREVTVAHAGPLPRGEHRTVWDGTDASGNAVASGVYFVVLEADGVMAVKKMALVR